MAKERNLRAVIASALGVPVSQICEETRSGELEQWDSLGHLAILTEIELIYGIALTMEDAIETNSVCGFRELLAERGVATS